MHHQRGADYTPQIQGPVERANRTVKRAIWKLLRELGLPRYCSKWFWRGVCQNLNKCVHAKTERSPEKDESGGKEVLKISPLSVGDRVVSFKAQPKAEDSLPVHGVEGFFAQCHVENESVVCIVVKKGNGWRPLRMHPS
mmetsp:Transcript_30151/g.59173  ORF Transcript_30151/g.59173 Transcript_30151/m.59173 type:complete len:139 (+) Transcript_30151:375-791(+)